MKSVAFYIRNTYQFESILSSYSMFLGQNGYQTIILHINSITPDLEKKHQLPNDVKIFDISQHSVKALEQFIKQNNVVGFVAINFHSTLDIMLNLFFQALKIPTLYMEHGILAEKPGQMIVPPNKILSLKRQTVFLKKYLSLLLFYTKKQKNISILFDSLIRKKFAKIYYNAYLLYAKKSLHKIKNTLTINKNNVYYSGYPITNYNEIKPAETLSEPYYIYIHQPYVFHKLGSCTYQNEFDFLNQLNKILIKAGKQLVIKLHPVETIEKYQKELDSSILFINSNDDLPAWIQNVEGVLGHYSTVLFMAIKFKKPIIQIAPLCWPKNQHFEIFKDVAIQSNTLENFNLILNNKDLLTQKLLYYKEFIDNEIGEHNTYEHRTHQIINVFENI